MQIEFSKEEAQAIVQLIARADIKGAEAPFVVNLMNKFQPILKEEVKQNAYPEQG